MPKYNRKEFVNGLFSKALKDPKRIILPEVEDDRIMKAADACASEGIARIILVGDRKLAESRISRLGLKNLAGARIVDPKFPPKDYSKMLYGLRKDKGMALDEAKKLLLEPIYYGTMMLYDGEADGLVSGASHPTAHTFGPALRILKTQPGIRTASTYFLMLLDDRVLFYADCSMNILPDPEQLADIAIATADTAASYGFKPKVAMLSFSTKGSGKHETAERVAKAAEIAKQKRPDIALDGELQVDAALVPEISRMKAPGSPVKGDANVLIFPNLDSGNISYKLTERLAGASAIGPISQGILKPVNDLSRGCSVEDVVEVVAITVIQAQQK